MEERNSAVIISERLKQMLEKDAAILIPLVIDGKKQITMTIKQPTYDIKITEIKRKLVYGIRFLLFEKSIALVMRVNDNPLDPVYFDHYLNPSKPYNVELLKEIAEKNNFGFCVLNPEYKVIHLSTLPLSLETISGLQKICDSLPIQVSEEEFMTEIGNTQKRLNPSQLWNYGEDAVIKDFRSGYLMHVKRAIDIAPVHKDLCEGILMNKGFVENIVTAMESKYKLCLKDHSYHCQLTAFPLPLPAPSFCVFEIGCAESISDFRNHFIGLGFDSYKEYFQGIFTCDGKGITAYQMQTGEIIPETAKQTSLQSCQTPKVKNR